MTNDEEDRLHREEIIPAMTRALHSAFEEALAAGHSVMIAEKGALYMVHPDRSRTFVKSIKPPTLVEKGRKMKIKFTTPHVQRSTS